MNIPYYGNMYAITECKSEYCDGYGPDIITDTKKKVV